MKFSLSPTLLVTLSMLAIGGAFQNCAPVNFESAKVDAPQIAASGEPEPFISEPEPVPETTAQPTPMPTAEATPTPEPPGEVVCIDSTGRSRTDSESWSESKTELKQYACPDAPDRSQSTITTTTYKCDKGTIATMGSTTSVLNPLPACPDPSLTATASPANPAEGTGTELVISTQYVSSVTYSCRIASSNASVKSGTVAPGSARVALPNVTSDLACEVTAKNSAAATIKVQVEIAVNCGAKFKVGGKCEEFSCKTIQTISPNSSGVLEVPARSAAGVCFAIKIMDALPNQTSIRIGKGKDADVISRNHDNGWNNPNNVAAPYRMGNSILDFRLLGARQVKLSGQGSSLASIQVDNFVLVGTYPKSIASPDARYFRAYGTSDSSVRDTNSVLFKGTPIAVKPFGSGGTATVSPLDITPDVSIGDINTFDVRALDCGSSGTMSNLFLLFQ